MLAYLVWKSQPFTFPSSVLLINHL